MNRPRTIPEIFISSRATTQQLVSVYDALKDFLAVDPEIQHLPSDLDRQLIHAYKNFIKSSISNTIPLHACTAITSTVIIARWKRYDEVGVLSMRMGLLEAGFC